MSDLADTASNAIIRPSLNFCFLLVGTLIDELKRGVENPKTFGRGFTFSEGNSKDCCGALFISEIDGGIRARQFWQLKYFFSRDGNEAVVFEFDRWGKHFHARRLEQLWERRKP